MCWTGIASAQLLEPIGGPLFKATLQIPRADVVFEVSLMVGVRSRIRAVAPVGLVLGLGLGFRVRVCKSCTSATHAPLVIIEEVADGEAAYLHMQRACAYTFALDQI